MDELIVVTVTKGDKVKETTFDNTGKGQKLATAFCKEVHKEHMQQPFFQLMELANGKPELQDFLRNHTKTEPASLAVKIETFSKEDYELL
jgi:hypothetical protein